MRKWDIMTCYLLYFLKAGLHSPKGLDLEEFIADIIIPALLPFCIKEFVDFRFQASIQNPEFVGGQI